MVISLMSQFLGLDTDRYAIEMLMILLFRVSIGQYESQSSQSVCLKFDEFLVESIHSQLVNFHNTIFFRFQSYLVRMFLFFNEESSIFLEMLLTNEIDSNFFKYMNLLM